MYYNTSKSAQNTPFFMQKEKEIRGKPHSREGIEMDVKPLSFKGTFKLWVYNGSFEKKKNGNSLYIVTLFHINFSCRTVN